MVPALLILLGAMETLQTDLFPDKTFLLLPPVNFTIKVTGLAQVLLCWEPNPDQGQRTDTVKYHVKINAPQQEDYETRNSESKCETTLHQGFSASVRTILWRDHSFLASSWVSAEHKAPPGSPGTSIVNLTCTTNTAAGNFTDLLKSYQVSLHCTWLAGKDAPEDTQYFLYYRYGPWTEECQKYSKDTLNRNTACWFPRTFIHSKARDRLAVHVNGSSKHAAIKPFDQLFDTQAIDQPNPPMNVTAETEGSRLSIQWEKPVSAFPIHCFDYEVKIYNTKGYYQVEKTTTNAFVSTTDGVSKYSIQVRAAVSTACRAMGLWSKWSQPIYVEQVSCAGTSSNPPSPEMRRHVNKSQSQTSKSPKETPKGNEMEQSDTQPPGLPELATKEDLEKMKSEIISHITAEIVPIVQDMINKSREDT
ncbi:Interleukin-5 receptor subunit alpha [Heterocephalus glaber]|uniref:Interleukin-5 receptor subunit alpha n=1 Tax=Heterocephalus glaber TaxID=10181 RepID=G5BKR7_HETGA|nr:Interleukin-5 receptor subunit alpha [Heterocephalus glaber]